MINNNYFRLFGAVLVISVLSVSQVVAGYPDVQDRVEPTTIYPPSFSAFNPPVDASMAINAVAPQTAEWTRQSQPGDTMALTAENLNQNFLEFVVYGENAERVAVACDIVHVDGRQAAVTLSDALTPNEFYLMWLGNANGFGEPVGINQTEAWWVGFDQVDPGETFYVYGRNLKLGAGECHLYIKELDRWLTSANANPYRAPFIMPSNVPAGTYTIYAHNGHGKVYGWAKPMIIKVDNPYDWSGNQYNLVTDFGANGTDKNDDQEAFNAMQDAVSANPGSTVTIPAGTYYLSGYFTAKPYTRYYGAGMGQTVIKPLPTRGKGDYLRSGSSYELKDMTFVADETIVTDNAFKFNEAWAHDALLERVEFIDTREEDYGLHGFLSLNKSARQTLRGCRFITYHSVLVGQASYLRMENCEFLGCHDNNQMMTMGGGGFNDISGCTAQNYDMSDASDGFGWAKGRWIVVSSRFSNIYLGGNRTVQIQPRDPTPFVLGLKVSSVGEFGNVQQTWYGTFGEQTLSFSTDIPDELHGRGNNSIPWSGAMATLVADGGAVTRDYRVRTLDAHNNTLTIQVTSPLATDQNWETVEIKDIVDGNAGEQILFEGPQPRQAGWITGATDGSVFISSADASGGLGATELFITGGRGLGQARPINSINATTGEVILEESWQVAPDNTSTYSMGIGAGNVAIYDNDFSGRESGIGFDHRATTALQANNAYNLIFADNTLTNVRNGVRLYGYHSEMDSLSGKSAPAPNFFFQCINNVFSGVADGFVVDVFSSGSNPLVPGDSWSLGHMFRGNRMENITYQAAFHFRDGNDADGAIGMNVIDGNQVSDLSYVENNGSIVSYADVLDLDPYASDQVLVNNRFFGHSKIAGLDSLNVVLRGNYWSGFSSTYSTDFSRLSIPQPVAKSSTVVLWNTGTSSMNWTSPTLGGGVIVAEGSTNLNDVPEGVHTIIAGSQTMQIEVFHLSPATLTELVSFPVLGLDGELVSAELVNQETGGRRALGPWNSPATISVEGLSGPGELLIIKKWDAVKNIWIPVSTNLIGRSPR
ncbi:glycosyl hydrolase family 28-related protein [Pontiella sulfatireligans]|uniref:Rhamnogalacturonase A/B/Epimerase-like pectate lyase domain-containing protein n=1 Tax=Pontiella sulfatireligans TaxID=2750658 RepID=A0A6C2UP10_9BACT|nr:glycosyl hydrolase family 28-related protein [Pontiella sulfatireligans]VGO21683.1 hypothetical protein SCARR_03757 [Pontiella sulfatireligans]